MKMTFGKHKGKPVGEVPSDYLQWVLDEADGIDVPLRRAVFEELKSGAEWRDADDAEPSESETSTARVHPGVSAWKQNWRSIYQLGHPGKGGDERLFKLLVGINLEMSKAS